MFCRDHKTAKIGEEILPLDMDYLPEFFKGKAEAELNYTPTMRERSLRKLKEAIAVSDDRTLKRHSFRDPLLLLFLNSKKYDIRKTVSHIKRYIKYSSTNSYMFTGIKFENLYNMVASELLFPLPWRCQDGCAILVVQLGNYDLENFHVTDFKRLFLVLLLQMLKYPMTEVNGFKCIFDLNITTPMLRICTPQNLGLLYNGAVNVLPGRIKGYHIVNMGAIGKTVYNIMKVFLSQKVKSRIHFHDTNQTLQDFFPKAILPVNLGGDLKECEYDSSEWLRKVTSPEELAILNILTN